MSGLEVFCLIFRLLGYVVFVVLFVWYVGNGGCLELGLGLYIELVFVLGFKVLEFIFRDFVFFIILFWECLFGFGDLMLMVYMVLYKCLWI